MTKTKTIHTEYGEKEIEVVTCDSCGQKADKDEAYKFSIGEPLTFTDGWACEHCATNEPAGFPMPDSESDIDVKRVLMWYGPWVMAVIMAVAVVILT